MPEEAQREPEPDRAQRRPGPSRSVTLEHIAGSTVVLADARGLHAVTMRTVAAAVGLSAAGLYRYVGSRDELIGHMVDTVSAEVTHPDPSGDWIGDLTGVAEQQVRLFRAHPWMVEAVGSLQYFGPHVLDHLDWGLAVLDKVDATNRDKLEAIALVNGVAALFAGTGQAPGPEAFSGLDPRRQPRLAKVFATAESTAASADLFSRLVEGLLHTVLGTRPAPRRRVGSQPREGP
jgi:AcrR family transcriptional regulator